MLISMTPNEEVKTIHASLNDGKLRKWEFEPYTEQGKIELTDQDYATIQSIKGNTVKFNQLISGARTWTNEITDTRTFFRCQLQFFNDNTFLTAIPFGDLTNPQYIKSIFTASVNANRIVYKHNGSTIDIVFKEVYVNIYQGHKYYTCFNAKGVDVQTVGGMIIEDVQLFDLTAMGIDNLTTVEQVETWLSNNIGLLSYYDYTLGSLISFNGTGLKTIGKNLLDTQASGCVVGKTILADGTYGDAQNITSSDYISVLPNSTLTYSSQTDIEDNYNKRIVCYDANKNFLATIVQTTGNPAGRFSITGTVVSGTKYVRVSWATALTDVILEYGSTATDYEPYTENILSLETLNTLFPTGMKNIPNTDVYDEVTSSRADTRVGSVTLNGSENWFFTSYNRVYVALPNAITGSITGFVADKYLIYSGNSDPYCAVVNTNGNLVIYAPSDITSADDWKIWLAAHNITVQYELATPISQDISLDLTYPIWNNGTEQILPINGSTPTTSPMVATIEYPDRTEDVNFLYKQTTFESAIPQFSLVCKNQELPMTLNDGELVCECDSSITNESGFFDCKVKMQDLDSVAYSQKIQLHVERGIND